MNFDFAKEERKSAQNLMNSCFFQAQRIHPRERKCPIRKKKKKQKKKKKESQTEEENPKRSAWHHASGWDSEFEGARGISR